MPKVWTAEMLQPLRSLGDPLGDAAVTELFAEHDVIAMNALMRNFVSNEHLVPAELPQVVRDYLEHSGTLPEWVDADLVATGENIFWEYGPQLILILTCYSLPFCYLGQHGVPVLAMTERLSSNPRRRIVETAQMVVDCMQAGGLTTPGGRGILTIQKVRLMHAAIRRLAPLDPRYSPTFGTPVNQEDLAGTLLSFSWIGIDGLARLGIELSEKEQRAYLHCWNIVGHLLGVQRELLMEDPAEAKALADGIAAHQFLGTDDGKLLTKSLVDMIAHVLPGNIFDRVPQLMMRFFLGREWAGWLGIQDDFLAKMAASPLRFLGREFGGALEDSATVAALAEHAGKLLIESIVYVERGGNRPTFAIPQELRQQWGVNWT